MAILGGDSGRPGDHFRSYLEEVEGYPRLGEKVERDLLEVVAGRERDPAKRRVVEANLRLVVDVARG